MRQSSSSIARRTGLVCAKHGSAPILVASIRLLDAAASAQSTARAANKSAARVLMFASGRRGREQFGRSFKRFDGLLCCVITVC